MKKRKTELPTLPKTASAKALTDVWAATKARIEELATEQTSADIALVEATRALAKAQADHDRAVARKTAAENRLATFRKRLGGE